jgi:hypothetical protein
MPVRHCVLVAVTALIVGCADRPLPIPGPDMGVQASTVARACATLTGCDLVKQVATLGSFASSMATCVNAFTGMDRRDIQYSNHIDQATLACLAGVGSDCSAALTCLNGGSPPTCTTFGSTCDGTIERHCTNTGQSTAFDCASVGLTCISFGPQFGGACGAATCTKEFEAQCVGDLVTTCENTLVLVPQTDCAPIGGTCTDVNVAPTCQGRGDPCTDGTAPTCQNNLAVSCLGGRTAIQDCTGARLRCDHGKCVPLDSCNVAPSCTGTILTVCGPDGSESVDCAALGFAGCDPTNGGRCTAH